MIRAVSSRNQARRRPRGSIMVESALVLSVFLGFIFLTADSAYAIFTKATLQHAVRTGVRYAVTSQTMTSGGTSLGQVASIKQQVKAAAMGILSDSDLNSYVSVSFYSVSSSTPQLVTGVGSNRAGNLVVVSVNGWQYQPIAPGFYSSTPLSVSVSSGDLIESSGSASTPPPL